MVYKNNPSSDLFGQNVAIHWQGDLNKVQLARLISDLTLVPESESLN